MDRKFFKGLAAGFIISFVFSTFLIWLMVRDRKLNIPYGQNAMNATMDEIQNCIDENYLGEYDMETLYNGAYKGYVEALGDKYSEYYPGAEKKTIEESLEGVVCDLGIYMRIDDKTKRPTVLKTVPGQTAYKNGIEQGDIIISINGIDTIDMGLKEVQQLMEGEAYSDIAIIIQRSDNRLEFELKRNPVNRISVRYEMLENKVAFISVDIFETTTIQQFITAVEVAELEEAEGIIVDLRNNGGGFLDAAVMMCDCFLPTNKLVTYTVDKYGNKNDYFTKDDMEIRLPLAILINSNSASSSEVFSECLSEYGVAKLFGEKSFGKGVAQTIFYLGNGNSMKLTTSMYYSPKGVCINGVGIDPDFFVKDKPNTEIDEVVELACEYLISAKNQK